VTTVNLRLKSEDFTNTGLACGNGNTVTSPHLECSPASKVIANVPFNQHEGIVAIEAPGFQVSRKKRHDLTRGLHTYGSQQFHLNARIARSRHHPAVSRDSTLDQDVCATN